MLKGRQFVPSNFAHFRETFEIVFNLRILMLLLAFIQFGGQSYEEVERTSINCTVLPDIECYGNRTFLKENVPCIK